MAKKTAAPFNYTAERDRLRKNGPERLYMLWGEEDYLRDTFLAELRGLCVAEGTEAFNYHRLRGPVLDARAMGDAVEAMPFMGDRTLIEVRDVDINKTSCCDPDELKALTADIPDWATVVFVFAVGYTPDGRLTAVKTLRKNGREIAFSSPEERQLIRWVQKRAQSAGKTISGPAARYLLSVCGPRMNAMIPEIVKIAGAAKGDEITAADIDAVAERSPETTIFQLTDALGEKKFDKAASLLADLLADRDEPPEKQIYMVSEQFRRLYAARTARDFHLGDDYITDCIPELAGRPYFLDPVKRAAGNFSRARLARAVELCAACEFGMRDGGPAPAERMKELLVRLALEA